MILKKSNNGQSIFFLKSKSDKSLFIFCLKFFGLILLIKYLILNYSFIFCPEAQMNRNLNERMLDSKNCAPCVCSYMRRQESGIFVQQYLLKLILLKIDE